MIRIIKAKMKKLKVKVNSGLKKSSDVGKAVKNINVGAGKSKPSEEEIRIKASEIYYERMARGEHGTPEGDWLEAEAILLESTRE